jgi:hypothetical protein
MASGYVLCAAVICGTDALFKGDFVMNRREALRLLAGSAALPLAPPGIMAMLREARALVGDQPAPRTLNPHQNATLKAIAELIIPRTETPGAADVGACEFVDLMLTEWYDPAEKQLFLEGLSDLDTRTAALFGRKFVECPSDQQAAMLEELGEKMTEEADRAREQPPGASDAGESFYPLLRRLVLTAYYTSEAGATDELHFEIIPGRYDGCAPTQPGKEGAERQ